MQTYQKPVTGTALGNEMRKEPTMDQPAKGVIHSSYLLGDVSSPEALPQTQEY